MNFVLCSLNNKFENYPTCLFSARKRGGIKSGKMEKKINLFEDSSGKLHLEYFVKSI